MSERDQSSDEISRWSHLPDADAPCPLCDVVGQPSMDHTADAQCVNTECDVVHYRQDKDT